MYIYIYIYIYVRLIDLRLASFSLSSYNTCAHRILYEHSRQTHLALSRGADGLSDSKVGNVKVLSHCTSK